MRGELRLFTVANAHAVLVDSCGLNSLACRTAPHTHAASSLVHRCNAHAVLASSCGFNSFTHSTSSRRDRQQLSPPTGAPFQTPMPCWQTPVSLDSPTRLSKLLARAQQTPRLTRSPLLMPMLCWRPPTGSPLQRPCFPRRPLPLELAHPPLPARPCKVREQLLTRLAHRCKRPCGVGLFVRIPRCFRPSRNTFEGIPSLLISTQLGP